MRNVYSVSQVNRYIRNMFSEDYFLQSVLVRGEVSNCKYHSSGHIYFTLKDASGTLSCVMFAGRRRGLSFRMQEGDQVIAAGTVDVYERDGRYQLYADRIIRDGVGLLNQRYEMLKRKLEESGMFDELYKKPIPRYIRTLGVVTAPTGAAVQDIINISLRRNPYLQIILYPAVVQGEGAAPSICEGIRTLDAYGVERQCLNVRHLSYPRWAMRQILSSRIMLRTCGPRPLLQPQNWRSFPMTSSRETCACIPNSLRGACEAVSYSFARIQTALKES